MKKGYLLAALALVLVILGLAVFTDQGLLGLYRLRQEKARMEERLAQLETENARLRVEIERLKSDRAYLEKVAREELGLVNQDEMVFQFRSEPGKAAPHP
jgi:cell division protein FtsL